ncbi:MAG: YfhO family protein [Chloroflexota bacterium]
MSTDSLVSTEVRSANEATSRAKSGLLAGSRLNLLVCSALFVLAFAFIGGGLPPARVAAPMEQLLVYPPWHSNFPDVASRLRGNDAIMQQLPWHHWQQDEFRAGRFPLWASGPLGGYPLFASYQPGVLFPLHLLWNLMPIGAGFGIIMALKLWLAGVGMWFFLRALSLHWTAALLGAVGFMFSAGLVVWLPWAHTAVYIMLPWLAWAAYEWCANRQRGALVGLAAACAIAIFGGHPETLFLVGVATGIFALGLIVGSPRQKWGWQVLGLGAAGAVGVAIGAIQLFPFYEALGLSHATAIRTTGDGTAGIHLYISSMLDWLLPRSGGQVVDGVLGRMDNFTEANAYVGLATLLGLILAVVAAFRKQIPFKLTLPWLVIAIFAWLAAYDDTMGRAIRSLPVFNQSVNGRWVLVVAFAFLVLSAFGWDWLARRIETRAATSGWQPIGRTAAAGIVLLALGIATMVEHLAGLFQQPDMGPRAGVWYIANFSYAFYWAVWSVGVAMALVGALLLWVSGWRGGRVMPFVLPALLVADLWMLLYTYNGTAPADQYFPQTSFIQQLSIVPPTEHIVMQGEVMPSNSGLVYNVRDWRGQDPMLSQRAFKATLFLSPEYKKTIWTEYNMFFPSLEMPVAPALGIRYFIMPRDTDPNWPSDPDDGHPVFKRLAFKDELGLWEAQGVPGFAYLSDYVTPVPGEPEAQAWMKALTWGQMRGYEAMVEAPADAVASIQHAADKSSPGAVAVSDYTPGHVRLEVDAARPSLLVVAESYYPGWHATMDGQPTVTLRANYLSQGVVVPQGKHTIELKYEPDSFKYGTIVSLFGLLGLCGLGVWARFRRNRAKT